MGTDQRARGALLRLLLLGALLGPSCGEGPPETPMRPVEPAFERVTRAVFGDAAEPSAVVATVDGTPITVGELAVCLETTPLRTVDECLDDLVVALLARGRATPQDRIAPDLADARLAALASAYLREHVELDITPAGVDESTLERFMAQAGNRFYVANPELRQCSHLLVSAGREQPANDATRELAARIRRSLDEVAGEASDSDLARARRAFASEARDLGLSVRVETHFLAQAVNQEPGAWPGVPTLAQPFADAVFALPAPGALSEPVDTEFGTHVALLERIFPASALSAPEAERVVRQELATRQRYNAVALLVARLTQAADIVRYNAIELFRLDDEAIIQERSAAIRQSLGAH